jgi:deoxyribose-phosphate aldolase
MLLKKDQITAMMDLSVLRADCKITEVDEVADIAKKYNCGCIIVWPSYVPYLLEKISDRPDIRPASVISFPGGSSTTAVKVLEARNLIKMGCVELDMVLNIGLLKSGRNSEVFEDINAVVEEAGKVPVRVIMETHYLSDNEIKNACDSCIKAKAAFVKTGTGWTPTGATLENIALIKNHVKDAIGIKASGGIKGLDTLAEMYKRGATKFGIGLRTVDKIFEQMSEYTDGLQI